jgi:hypothetical protein
MREIFLPRSSVTVTFAKKPGVASPHTPDGALARIEGLGVGITPGFARLSGSLHGLTEYLPAVKN